VRVAGFRIFSFRDGRLHSVVHDHLWERGVNQSKPCSTVSPIFSDDPVLVHPSHLCRCGFHAFYDEDHPELIASHTVWTSIYVSVTAVIVGTDRVVLHQRGWRARKAEIVGVVATTDRLIDNVIRNHYDVAMVRPEGVRSLAEKYGILGQNFDEGSPFERHWGIA